MKNWVFSCLFLLGSCQTNQNLHFFCHGCGGARMCSLVTCPLSTIVREAARLQMQNKQPADEVSQSTLTSWLFLAVRSEERTKRNIKISEYKQLIYLGFPLQISGSLKFLFSFKVDTGLGMFSRSLWNIKEEENYFHIVQVSFKCIFKCRTPNTRPELLKII